MKYKVISIKVLFVLLSICCATPYIIAPIALVGGFFFTLFFGYPFSKPINKITGLLLKSSVVGLGFGMNIHSTLEVGKQGLLLTIGSVSLILMMGVFIGKWLGMRKTSSYLIASGTAICGGSAIAAIAPIIQSSKEDISISLGVIFLLNSIALLLFPAIGHLFNLNQIQFGMWSAIAIHDTSSVVGAASAYGEHALQVATTVKLARALWIIPIGVLSIFLFKSENKKINIPWFIGFFILAMLANSYIPQVVINTTIVSISKSALVVTLFLIGADLSVSKIKSVGWKPLLLGILLWFTISITSFIYIIRFF